MSKSKLTSSSEFMLEDSSESFPSNLRFFELKMISKRMPEIAPPVIGPTQKIQWFSHLLKTKDGPSERAGFK